jgi:hypothetical protein
MRLDALSVPLGTPKADWLRQQETLNAIDLRSNVIGHQINAIGLRLVATGSTA